MSARAGCSRRWRRAGAKVARHATCARRGAERVLAVTVTRQRVAPMKKTHPVSQDARRADPDARNRLLRLAWLHEADKDRRNRCCSTG